MVAPLHAVPIPPDPDAFALVWIDAKEASIVTRTEGRPSVDRVTSDVPPHRRSTGHHERGAVATRDQGEPHRLEHLAHFVREVAHRVPATVDVLVVGPGTVRSRLARALRVGDTRQGVRRVVHSRPAPRWTRRRLLAEFRFATGEVPRRRTVGAYRWSRAGDDAAAPGLPVRVVPKPRQERS